jgi:LysR family glycine cleavage system transcriptional activator
MFQRLPSLKALYAFEAAARHLSFRDGAAELSLTQGAVSYQVKQLESSLGVALFHRRTRQVVLTEAGQQLYRFTHRIFRELEAEVRSLSPGIQTTALTVSVSTYLVTRWLSPRLGRFLQAHPDITVRLQHSVNDPEFTIHDVDLGIRWGDGKWQNWRSEPLMEMPMVMVCAPRLLAGDGAGPQPREILRHTLLRDQAGVDYWSEWLRVANLDSAAPHYGHIIRDPNVRIQSAIDGHGLVLANLLVEPEITAGHLVEPWEYRLNGYGYHIIHGKRTVDGSPADSFRRWLHSEAKQWQQATGSG